MNKKLHDYFAKRALDIEEYVEDFVNMYEKSVEEVDEHIEVAEEILEENAGEIVEEVVEVAGELREIIEGSEKLDDLAKKVGGVFNVRRGSGIVEATKEFLALSGSASPDVLRKFVNDKAVELGLTGTNLFVWNSLMNAAINGIEEEYYKK